MLVPLAALLAAVPVTFTLAAPAAPSKLEIGKKVYRKYCGQCHALNEALAAGFGSDKGLGTDGGPSFNNLKVPYNLSHRRGDRDLRRSRARREEDDLGPAEPGRVVRRHRDEEPPVPRAPVRRLDPRETSGFPKKHDEREDAAVAEVLALAWGVEADDRLELASSGLHRDLAGLAVLDSPDRELLAAGEAERLAALAGPYWSGRTPIISRFERWIRS